MPPDVLISRVDVELVRGVVEVAGVGACTVEAVQNGVGYEATVDLPGERIDGVGVVVTQQTPARVVLEAAVRAALAEREEG